MITQLRPWNVFCLFVCLTLLSYRISAQDAHGNVRGVSTSVCTALSNSHQLQGRRVKVRGVVTQDFENFFVSDLTEQFCNQSIWLQYVQKTEGQASDSTTPRFQSNDLARLHQLLGATLPDAPGRVCRLGPCKRYKVVATLEGKLEFKNAKCSKATQPGVGCGYGNLGKWTAKLLIESVSDIDTTEIKY